VDFPENIDAHDSSSGAAEHESFEKHRSLVAAAAD